MKFRGSVLALIAAAGLIVAGCGSSNQGTASSTPAATTTGSAASAGPGTGASSAAADTGASSMAPQPSGPQSSAGGEQLSGTLTVYAAASLKKVFDQLAADFGKEHPGLTVKPITYDGSSTLATQLIGGADADVFASADNKNMAKVTTAKLATGPVEFATNTLQIAVAPGNPKKIAGIKDLTAAGLTVVICAPEVPCGSAAQTVLKDAGVTLKPASEEQNVTAVLTKVKSGDADAGLVYKTDVLGAAGKVEGVDFPEAAKAVNHYPIVALTGSKNPAAAKAFIAYVTGPVGQKALAAAGFVKP